MVNKNKLNILIKTQDLDNLEKHLLYTYIKTHKIDTLNSSILKNYFINFTLKERLFLEISNLGIDTFKDLENSLELIIPESDRKLNGAFFTPNYIVDFIINEISPQLHHTNLDPSCGSGAFLIGLVEYYKDKFQLPIKKIVKENIFGADILIYNINRSKVLMTIYALQFGEVLEEQDFNIYLQNSLKTDWADTYDNIVGNPPYVRFQDLEDTNRDFLANNWRSIHNGSFNLYFAFFELGYKLLKPTGKLGYITPNNYFTSLAGESLRKYFHEKKCVTRIIDFSHKKVFDAQTYTALTFINKQENNHFTFDRIPIGFEPELFLPRANGSPIFLKKLNTKKWRLLKSDEQSTIQTLESIGSPIGKLFDISVGVATLQDDVFFIDGNLEKGGYYIKKTGYGVFEIEKDITKPVYKISDFTSQDEIEKNRRRIICPYYIQQNNAIPIKEEEFKEKFPKCYNYLSSEKARLLKRDKGKIAYEPFYIWGRSQGLTKKGKRLLNPTFSKYPRFLRIDQEDAYYTNGYGIFFKNNNITLAFNKDKNPIANIENIDLVQKILNSNLMHYYVSKTSVSIDGGYPCYQKNFIEKFTIPYFTQNELDTLRSLIDTLEIDGFLETKYQINLPEPNLFS